MEHGEIDTCFFKSGMYKNMDAHITQIIENNARSEIVFLMCSVSVLMV